METEPQIKLVNGCGVIEVKDSGVLTLGTTAKDGAMHYISEGKIVLSLDNTGVQDLLQGLIWD